MRIVAALLAVGALTTTLLWKKDSRRAALAESEVARLQASEAGLKAKLAQVQAAAGIAVEDDPDETARPEVRRPDKPVVTDDSVTRNELVKLLDEKRLRIEEIQKSLDETDARLKEAESKIASLTQESQKAIETKRDLEDRLATANRVSAALDEEIKGRNDRMVRIDSANREIQKKYEEISKQVVKLSRAANEIEDITRRRDVYLNNVLRRYREVTDMYRSLAMRMNSPRETGLPSPGTDLSRIQNAIMLAEEDLRQLQTLNAQAARLQKDLAAASR